MPCERLGSTRFQQPAVPGRKSPYDEARLPALPLLPTLQVPLQEGRAGLFDNRRVFPTSRIATPSQNSMTPRNLPPGKGRVRIGASIHSPVAQGRRGISSMNNGQGYRNGPRYRQDNKGKSWQGPPSGPRPQNRPVAAAAPREPLASALRVRNFKLIVSAVGEEQVALRLDVPLQRVRELAEGVNFGNETTHHLEFTLGLRSGFMDLVNPELTPKDIERLKSEPENEYSDAEAVYLPPASTEPAPLLAVSAAAAPTGENLATTSAVPTTEAQLELHADLPAPETEMPRARKTVEAPENPAANKATPPAATSEAPAAPAKKRGRPRKNPLPEAAAPVAASAPAPAPAPAQAEVQVSGKKSPQTAASGPVTEEEKQLREQRRLNLALISSRPGGKSQLSRLVGLSPANISHRLHGNTAMDIGTAAFFCEKLQLPDGWLDQPRKESDVPEAVWALLSQHAAGSPSATKTAAAPRAPRKKAQPAAEISTSLAKPAETPASVPSSLLTEASASAAAAPAQAAVTTATRPAATKAPGAPAAAPAQNAVFAMAESLSPIAEALLKTLSLKARSGKLSEEQALRMLTEVSLL